MNLPGIFLKQQHFPSVDGVLEQLIKDIFSKSPALSIDSRNQITVGWVVDQ